MSKTPYEIRADLLSLTFNILNTNAERENHKAQTEWHFRMDNLLKNTYTEFPKPVNVTVEDIINEAHKLNQFVTDGKK